MIYPNNTRAAALAMEKARIGGDDERSSSVCCDECGCDIADTRTRSVYVWNRRKLCDDCLRDALFDDFADECGTPLEEWEV